MILALFALLVVALVAAVSADSYRRSYYAERRAHIADDVDAAQESHELASHRDAALRALHESRAEVVMLRSTVELRDGDLAAARAEVADLANELALSKHDVLVLETTIDEMAMQAHDAAAAYQAAAPKRRGRPVGAKTKAKK